MLERLMGRRRARIAGQVRQAVTARRGFEVGGPSRIFGAKGRLPVYPYATALDGADYRAATRRHPSRSTEAGFSWRPDRAPGRLFLCEAADLAEVPDAGYEFLLASHVLEHVANPLRALRTWRRVVQSGGVLVLVVPHQEGTFDHLRPVTTLAHLREDFERDVGEDDRTHFDEILALHDLTRDPGLHTQDALEAAVRGNVESRGLHHHVFDTELVLRAADDAGWQVEAVEPMRPYHVAVLARRSARGEAANAHLWAADAGWRARSPFRVDREGGATA